MQLADVGLVLFFEKCAVQDNSVLWDKETRAVSGFAKWLLIVLSLLLKRKLINSHRDKIHTASDMITLHEALIKFSDISHSILAPCYRENGKIIIK